MKHISKFVLLIALLLIAAVPAVLAQDEDEKPVVPENSISGMIIKQGRYSTMEAAMEAAGLTDMFAGGEWTLFAPSNGAFSKLGLNRKNIADEYSSEELRDMILYHTLSGRKSTADLKTMLGDITMENGGLAGLKWYRNRIYVNDLSRVIGANIAADNGYIQLVDTVIQPPWPRIPEEAPVSKNSIAGLTGADGRFSTLAAAIMAAGLYDDLGRGEWTLFAPTDDAFARYDLDAENIAEEYSAGALSNLLKYHMLAGNHSTDALKTMQGDLTMANGGAAGLKYYEENVYVNDDSKVIEADILADNGTIQVVDNVVLPPWPRGSEPPDLTAEVQDEEQEAAEEQVQEETEEQVQVGTEEQVQVGTEEQDAEAAAGKELEAELEIPTVPENSIAGLAGADGRFSTLVAAAVAAGLHDDLGGGEWTLFAPTDDAFARLGLNAENIAEEYSAGQLSNMLKYHMLAGNHSTDALKTMQGDVTMANGGMAGLKLYEDHVYVNDDSKVTQANILANNGVFHVVDNVVLPPWPRVSEPLDLTGEGQDQEQESAEEQEQ